MAGRRRKKRPVYAAQKDLCAACGDPLIVCPATISRFIRCCDNCTHVTDRDKQWADTKGHLLAQKTRFDSRSRQRGKGD